MKTYNHHLHRFPHKTCLLIRLKNIFIDRTLSLLFTTYGSKFHYDICGFCKKRIFKNPSISFYKCSQIANMTTKLIWLRCDGYRKIFGITQSFSNQAQSYTLITSLIFLFDILIFFQLYRDWGKYQDKHQSKYWHQEKGFYTSWYLFIIVKQIWYSRIKLYFNRNLFIPGREWSSTSLSTSKYLTWFDTSNFFYCCITLFITIANQWSSLVYLTTNTIFVIPTTFYATLENKTNYFFICARLELFYDFLLFDWLHKISWPAG